MQPSDWLLAFIDAGGDRATDPVRLQKGLFLLAMSERLPNDQRYRFEPYAYGPMSRQLYTDLRTLEHSGLVELVPVPGARWRAARATKRGTAHAAACLVDPADLDAVRRLRAELDQLSFDGLLRRVYREHPAYAVNSVFRDR